MTKPANDGYHINFRSKLRYRFDALMARGAPGQFALLGAFTAVLSVIIISLTVLAVLVFGGRDGDTFSEIATRTGLLLLVPDPVDFNDDGVLMFTSGVISIIGGLFVGGTLIGILTASIEGRMEDLRRGRSFVAERHHTVILGWSSKVFRVIDEIAIANEDLSSQETSTRVIVVLADRDMVEMDEAIQARVSNLRGTRVVCRHGSAIVGDDLRLVNVNQARSVVILSQEQKTHPDSHVVKILLTLAHVCSRRDEPLPVTTEIRNESNRQLCEIIGNESSIQVIPVIFNALIPRLLAQSSRQPSLSRVYSELFDFDGDETYFTPLDDLKGPGDLTRSSFRDLVFAFDTSSVIGVARGDDILLNPDADFVCRPGDEVIAISEDDTTVIPDAVGAAKIDEANIVDPGTMDEAQGEHNVILGWTHHVAAVIAELDDYVSPGSRLTVISSSPTVAADLEECCSGLVHQTLDIRTGNIGDPDLLASIPFEDVDNILVLPDDPAVDKPVEEIDAVTIKSLVYLREIGRKRTCRLAITSQLLAKESSDVAEATGLGDFVVSDEIIGRIIAQVAEESRLNVIFDELLTPSGCDLSLRPMERYVVSNVEMTFHTVVEAALAHGQAAIGYFRGERLVINPRKTDRITFEDGDRLIVVTASRDTGRHSPA